VVCTCYFVRREQRADQPPDQRNLVTEPRIEDRRALQLAPSMSPPLRTLTRRTLTLLTLSTATAAGVGYLYLNSGPAYPPTTHESRRPPPPWSPPPRAAMIEALKRSANPEDTQFDILVVGGGATGAGVAVDAASRGLRVALVEREDFASGQSMFNPNANLLHTFVLRYLFQVNETCPWRRSLPPESRLRTRL
jgi:hypothetical protein